MKKFSGNAGQTDRHHLLTMHPDPRYAQCPLIKFCKVQTGEFVLPVATDLLSLVNQKFQNLTVLLLHDVDIRPDPASLQNADDSKSGKWIDGGKPIFRVRVQLDSTVLSDDTYLQGFFQNRLHSG